MLNRKNVSKVQGKQHQQLYETWKAQQVVLISALIVRFLTGRYIWEYNSAPMMYKRY